MKTKTKMYAVDLMRTARKDQAEAARRRARRQHRDYKSKQELRNAEWLILVARFKDWWSRWFPQF